MHEYQVCINWTNNLTGEGKWTGLSCSAHSVSGERAKEHTLFPSVKMHGFQYFSFNTIPYTTWKSLTIGYLYYAEDV